jgi:hypothetical protein
MKLTKAATYIDPTDNETILNLLLRQNCEVHEKLLTPSKDWSIEPVVMEEMRIDSEELALLMMRRTRQFAEFRTREVKKQKKSNRTKRIRVEEEDVNLAWESIQMDRTKL